MDNETFPQYSAGHDNAIKVWRIIILQFNLWVINFITTDLLKKKFFVFVVTPFSEGKLCPRKAQSHFFHCLSKMFPDGISCFAALEEDLSSIRLWYSYVSFVVIFMYLQEWDVTLERAEVRIVLVWRNTRNK